MTAERVNKSLMALWPHLYINASQPAAVTIHLYFRSAEIEVHRCRCLVLKFVRRIRSGSLRLRTASPCTVSGKLIIEQMQTVPAFNFDNPKVAVEIHFALQIPVDFRICKCIAIEGVLPAAR